MSQSTKYARARLRRARIRRGGTRTGTWDYDTKRTRVSCRAGVYGR